MYVLLGNCWKVVKITLGIICNRTAGDQYPTKNETVLWNNCTEYILIEISIVEGGLVGEIHCIKPQCQKTNNWIIIEICRLNWIYQMVTTVSFEDWGMLCSTDVIFVGGI